MNFVEIKNTPIGRGRINITILPIFLPAPSLARRGRVANHLEASQGAGSVVNRSLDFLRSLAAIDAIGPLTKTRHLNRATSHPSLRTAFVMKRGRTSTRAVVPGIP